MDTMSSAVLALAEKHLKSFRIKNGQVVAEYCPICNGHDKDKETFAIGLNNGLWQCLRGSCGKKGNFTQLCNYFGEEANVGYSLPGMKNQEKRKYDKPDQNIIHPLTDQIKHFFDLRCISEETLNDWKIGADENGNIIFPFYRNNELVYVKYRKPKKHKKEDGPKEWQMDNTEPILFGMDMTTFNLPLVITEGEMDALALYEAGVTNVVSVPSGCSNLNWINLCWDWLENFNQIILFGDSDEPGRAMVAEVATRLGEDRCMLLPEYPEFVVEGKDENRICKDANEILYCYGPEYLKGMVDACEPAPIKGVIDVGDIVYVDPISKPRIMTKIPMLDKMTGGFQEGGVSVLSGKSGEGRLLPS